MLSKAVRDLFAELYVTSIPSTRKIPSAVERIARAVGVDCDWAHESLGERALFEHSNLMLLDTAVTLARLGPNGFVRVCQLFTLLVVVSVSD
jgi:hypothetical protein